MKFDTPAGANPTDAGRVLGHAHDRIDGLLKTTGRAAYAYEHHDAKAAPVYGHVIGAAIAKGAIAAIDRKAALASPGVIAVLAYDNAGPFAKGPHNTAPLLANPIVSHYHQAVALVVADTFEQARAAAALVSIQYAEDDGKFDLRAAADAAPTAPFVETEPMTRVGDFERAFSHSETTINVQYATPDHSHMMMEPHATIAAWDGETMSVWTSNQMVEWALADLAIGLGLPPEKVRVRAPFIGGGFGAKLFLRADVALAALAAKTLSRTVKVALQRPLIANNATHRPATLQRLRIGAARDGKILAIAHESCSGDLPGGQPEGAVLATRLLYAGADRLTHLKLAALDLPEGNAMRAPGEASGLMALEAAMDKMAERLDMDPVAFRIANDTQADPEKPERPFSQRRLIECLQRGAEAFGWSRRQAKPAQTREGDWLIGMGVAAGYRGAPVMSSGARATLKRDGALVIETAMTDIGTGSYTILAQTAAEMLGLPLERVEVRLGDSAFPASSGSGGQWGAASATGGVYAACLALRKAAAEVLGFDAEDAEFRDGSVIAKNRMAPLSDATAQGDLVGEDAIEFGALSKKMVIGTFAAHFVEVAVHRLTGETRVRRMLAACDAGRIFNPKTARSQVIGGMTMGLGAALTEELAVDTTRGFFANHDLAGYEVPVHADTPHQEVIFLDGDDPAAAPLKGKGVGELGLCGVAAAIANAVYNATGVRVRHYPITLDKMLHRLPA